MYRGHALAPIVKDLRRRRLAGASIPELLDFLQTLPASNPIANIKYIMRSFNQGADFLMHIWPGAVSDPGDYDGAEGRLDRAQDTWARETYPEPMRLRDYYAFMEIAAAHETVLTVQGSCSAAGEYVQRSGCGVYRGRLPVLSRRALPHAGLLAADPQDDELVTLLRRNDLTYDSYAELLRFEGVEILGVEDRHVLKDAVGNRLYAPYRLLGVYDADSGQSAWTAKRGERLRAAINRRLGAELVLEGPHDDWELRNDPSTPVHLRGPLGPAISFSPRGYIEHFTDWRELARRSEVYADKWDRLYPGHPIEAPTS